MTISHKAISAARQMKEDIALRTGLAVVDSFDATGNPVLTIGTATSTNQGATVRIKMVETPMVDGLGNSQRVFAPHIVQLIVEESASAGVAVFNAANMLRVVNDILKHGMRLDVYLAANGQAPTIAGAVAILAVGPSFTLDHIWHPLTSSM